MGHSLFLNVLLFVLYCVVGYMENEQKTAPRLLRHDYIRRVVPGREARVRARSYDSLGL